MQKSAVADGGFDHQIVEGRLVICVLGHAAEARRRPHEPIVRLGEQPLHDRVALVAASHVLGEQNPRVDDRRVALREQPDALVPVADVRERVAQDDEVRI